ncbi:nucleoside-diphosphate kinase [Actinoplanes sp. NPDC023714]|uniref:nucleoside-diphosphate kinase n=1 Tax=Actinoplanes sp. NPDC023714 TaxID=3154322 RepID=UPI0033D035B9
MFVPWKDPRIEEPTITSSFLLLKPDCLRQALTGEAERVIAGLGLTIEERRTVTLTPAGVRVLWPEYSDDGHVLARAFLDRYLTSGPSEVVVVSGEDAYEKCRLAKRELRGRYAIGVFANVVHAAESRSELARQMAYLLGGVTAAAEVRQRPRGMDFRAVIDIPALVDELWPLLQQDLRPPPPHRTDASGTWALILGGDRDHTLDSTVTALWQAFPGIDPARAVLLALYADRTGGYPIATGSRRSMVRAGKALKKHGIRHCWTVSAPPEPVPATSAAPPGRAAGTPSPR